jgi:hypothetical protein
MPLPFQPVALAHNVDKRLVMQVDQHGIPVKVGSHAEYE